MNLYEALIAKPFFQALGWALIHFIWQGAIVAALYAGARIMLRRASSNTRYSVACAAMLLMLVLPATTLIVAFPSPTDGGDGYSVSTSGAEAKAFAEDASTVSDLSGALWQHPAYSSR